MLDTYPFAGMHDGDNIKTGFQVNIMLENICIGSTYHELLFFSIHKDLWLAKVKGAPGLHFYDDQVIFFDGNNIHFILVVVPVLLQDVEALDGHSVTADVVEAPRLEEGPGRR